MFFAVFLLGVVLTPGSFTASEIHIAHDGRYAAPLWPFACIVSGLALQQVGTHGSVGLWASRAMLGCLIAIFLAGFARELDPSSFPGSWNQNCTSQEELARFIAWKYKADEKRVDRVVERLEERTEEQRVGTIFVIAQALKHRAQRPLALDGKPVPYLEHLRHLRSRVGPRYALYCEDPWPGEPVYSWHQRDQFLRDRAERLRGADTGATSEPGPRR